MPIITLETIICAPVEVCFDLSRSIDLHTISTRQTGERAVAGVTKGLIGLGETVTWRARHFGIQQHLTSKITEYQRPNYFVDEMVQGAFSCFRHEHHFKQMDGSTRMTDVFNYSSPFGALGKLADVLILKNYMTNLLAERNKVIKIYAESGKGAELLKKSTLERRITSLLNPRSQHHVSFFPFPFIIPHRTVKLDHPAGPLQRHPVTGQ
jgi:ligand-binding SRPBCC domain-containing protein